MWKEGKVGPLPCIELAIAEGVRGIPRRLYGGRDPWMGWGIGVAMDAVLVPRALKDCGCWNPGKLVEEDTQELRDRLSDVVKADPASKEKQCLMFALHHTKQVKIAKREKKSFTARLILMTSCHWKDLSNTSSHIFILFLFACCCPYHCILDKFWFEEADCSGLKRKISFAHWTFLVLNTEEPYDATTKHWKISDVKSHCITPNSKTCL